LCDFYDEINNREGNLDILDVELEEHALDFVHSQGDEIDRLILDLLFFVIGGLLPDKVLDLIVALT
jgi:hypothetical protein